MKKIAMLVALLMVLGAAPGWCLVGMVDGFVDDHTKNSSYRPVQDAGELYGTINHGIGDSLDKVPVLKDRSVVISPIEMAAKETIKGTKLVLNGAWDLLTFKSYRDKK